MADNPFHLLLPQIQAGSFKALARCISLVENQVPGFVDFMKGLPGSDVPVIGITGPPGAGKSTLVDALIGQFVAEQKQIGVLCIDPSSPFNMGALLGDRIRMSDWYNHPAVFIRSLASRGSLGGLHPEIVEITDVMKQFPFDLVMVETVGVGQSEVEIAGLADLTIVVMVPEAGDEIQTMKAGLMEIADIFIVNKADRPEADHLVKYLKSISGDQNIPVLTTIATTKEGIPELMMAIENQLKSSFSNDKKFWLLAERAWHLLEKKRMQGLNKQMLANQIQKAFSARDFNLYQFIENF